ncbi:MAG: 3-isopropylmalate dehydrogenase [Oscillospiraceae bacterium]|nr:3-isopropylmalate dehydrogenase [Oscillospiraceae bacterium]
MNYNIALIRGDGIGPEVVEQAVCVLDAVGKKFGHTYAYTDVLLGGCATDAVGKSYPDGTAEKCKACDAVLLGAVGGPKWGSDRPAEERPETALLAIRKDLGLYANLRPAVLRPALTGACPLKPEIAEAGIDLMMVRELTGGVYFGKRARYDTAERGVECSDLMAYSEREIERIGRRAFALARLRRKKVTSVDKANVLETSRLWREVLHRIAQEYGDVEYEDMLVDNCAMQLVRNPGQFDVVVTENMFGDILSDEASMITGSIGLLPSASIGDGAPGLYEPIHGSAPDIAGQDKANPIATILSVAMMFRYSFQRAEEADAIEAAVDRVLAEGYHTADMAGRGEPIGTKRMGALICAEIAAIQK